jgi:hypothetical protein
MVTEAPVVGDRKRIDDALVSCAGLLRTLCHDEIGDTAAAELEYVRSCIIPAAAPAPGVVWQATEATDAMWEAARGRNSFAASYRAMIAAAPASPQPANPAQVTDAIRGIVEDALNSALPEPWEVAEHATQRILAAIGAGGQPIDQELRDAAKAMGAEVARDVPMVGAGGQVVAVEALRAIGAPDETQLMEMGDSALRGWAYAAARIARYALEEIDNA